MKKKSKELSTRWIFYDSLLKSKKPKIFHILRKGSSLEKSISHETCMTHVIEQILSFFEGWSVLRVCFTIADTFWLQRKMSIILSPQYVSFVIHSLFYVTIRTPSASDIIINDNQYIIVMMTFLHENITPIQCQHKQTSNSQYLSASSATLHHIVTFISTNKIPLF